MEQMLKNLFLFLSKNKGMTRAAKKYGLRFGASRFVAGETLEMACKVITDLNRMGLAVTIDYLGEFIEDEQEARKMADQCIEAIRMIGRNNLDSQLSLKLTSMGLDVSERVVMDNMRRILEEAKVHQVFVTLDMEDFPRCQPTLDVFKTLRAEYNEVGTVIQAYLYRSEKDIAELDELHPNLRLVKGAYKESGEVAFAEKKAVDDNFKQIIKQHVLNGNYTAVATHDDKIIDYTKELVKHEGISGDSFEFQMLYGIRNEKQLELVNEGYKVRVYVPYGTDWYGYFMRRLAERPANIAFVVKGLFKK
ncbi:proline dehydrogenase [Peribacillus muralis]|uniref:proline dehydrogenase family protein n=1 Tax=Peribacillus muralis TaxID=264697 RepID=UPI001F4D7350|nr:proline dehydrogenase [Peribacillus muralis]MCK1994338.1 proline dehydrogenase [Peribacillus muralis]MCK2014877.1 proline dehydrogenase [Peribacillus muralis]